jgi:hypothetical protein
MAERGTALELTSGLLQAFCMSSGRHRSLWRPEPSSSASRRRRCPIITCHGEWGRAARAGRAEGLAARSDRPAGAGDVAPARGEPGEHCVRLRGAAAVREALGDRILITNEAEPSARRFRPRVRRRRCQLPTRYLEAIAAAVQASTSLSERQKKRAAEVIAKELEIRDMLSLRRPGLVLAGSNWPHSPGLLACPAGIGTHPNLCAWSGRAIFRRGLLPGRHV